MIARGILWLLLLMSLASCSGPTMEEGLVGRWIEDVQDLRIEFTPNGIYSIRRPDRFVEVGLWSVQEEEVTMRSLTDSEVTTWKPDVSEDEFLIDNGEARFRRFQRIPLKETIVDERLVGLWRSDGKHPQFIEFTETATFTAIFRRLDKPGGDPYPVGIQAIVSRAGQSKFFLEGYFGDKRMPARNLPHLYKFKDKRLIWGKGRKHKPRVYRKITAYDVQEFAKDQWASQPAKVPTPTPSPSSSPK